MPGFVVLGTATLAVGALVLLFLLRAKKKKPVRPAREASAFVLLENNDWDSCEVDDVKEPWSRLATEAIRGFCGVSPGRHRIRTKNATLDFTVYPGEVLAWRLDADRARWEPYDLEGPVRASLEAAPPSTMDLAALASARPKVPGYLVHLRTTIGMVRARGESLPKPDGDAVGRVTKRLAKLVARAEAEGDEDLLLEAKALGETILGKALTRREMRALVAPARELADRFAAKGDIDRAMQIVGLGLAVLPGDPELMVVAGCALAARGEADEAMRALEAALERDRCLEASDVARAMRARMELRSRLGRSSVRVS